MSQLTSRLLQYVHPSNEGAIRFLKTPHVQRMLHRQRMEVWSRKEEFEENPMEWLAEFDRQERALVEELLRDLPDEYLSPQELHERRERQAEIPVSE